MKLKKVTAVLLIGAMACAMLAACGSSASSEEEAVAAAEGSAGGEDLSAEEEEYDGDADEVDMYALNFYGTEGAEEVEDAINEIAEEEIDVHVNYHMLDTVSYMEQIGLMLAGGEKADLLLCTAIPAVSFSTMQSQNQLMDISPYLEENAPELYEMMAEYLPATTIGDAIYAVPCQRQMNTNYYAVFRKDVLDELGLTEKYENMTTWTEFEEILYAIQEGQDSLPAEMQTNCVLSSADQGGTVLTSAGYDISGEDFTESENYDSLGDLNKIIRVDSSTDTVTNYFASDEYESIVNRAHQLYTDGIIYSDAATTEEGGDQLIQNGVACGEVTPSEYGIDAVKSAATGMEVICKELTEGVVMTANGNTWAWAVPTTATEPEAACRFMNLMYTNADVENLLAWGIEGRDYELNDAGEAVLLEDHVYQANDFDLGNQFLAYPAEGAGSDFREEAKANMDEAQVSKYFGCVINTDPIANTLTACVNVINEYEPALESGTSDPATELPAFRAALEEAGVQEVVDYYQEQLDAWLAEQ